MPTAGDLLDLGHALIVPLLLISGERDHTVPWAIVNASYKQQRDDQGVTEIEKILGRGHALIIDSGWREVADKAFAFVRRFVKSWPARRPRLRPRQVRHLLRRPSVTLRIGRRGVRVRDFT